MKKSINKLNSLWRTLFPGFAYSPTDGTSSPILEPLPTGAFYDGIWGFGANGLNPEGTANVSDDDNVALGMLPIERLARYPIYQAMATDPTIDTALKMHLTHALSSRSDTGEVVSIESTTDKDDPITIDLRNTFKDLINRNVMGWAFNAALYGCWFARVYGAPGVGVRLVRSDYYTHPMFTRMYERAGQLVGFTSAWQRNFSKGRMELMPPWSFVVFRIPYWKVEAMVEPVRSDAQVFDIASDDYENEGICESQNYGQSLIETAYAPWIDLQEAILSLNMSRKNAARLERLVGVNTGKMNPLQAAKYLKTISGILLQTQRKRSQQSLRRGFIQTIINHLVPIWGDGKGRLEISTIEGNPNIEGLADVQFHINRLGSALGIDPSLLGFGELLSGGLGDGGFFRVSILAAIRANLLRRAIASGLEQLFEIHVAYKWNKAFLPGEKPWRIMFNSVSSALDREEQENREGRANLAGLIAQLIQTIDPEMTITDRQALANFLWTDIMRVDEEKFLGIFSKSDKNPKEPAPDDESIDEEDVMESANRNRPVLQALLGGRK